MVATNASQSAVPGTNPTAYLNMNEPATVLRVIAQRAPTGNDRRQKLGTLWVDQTTNQSYQLTTISNGQAVWTLLGPGSSDVDTITGDSGGAISPSGGNITLAGGSNITTSGAGSTITFDLDSTLSGITSFSTGLLDVDNIEINGNTISSTNTNGNVNITPDGTGAVVISSSDINGGNIDGTVIGAATPAAGTFTNLTATNVATADVADGLTLNSNNIAADGTNTNIDITFTPKGTGNVDILGGSLDVQAGNVSLTGSATQLQVEGGAATDFIGTATLSSGTVTVANTNIAANDRIFLSYIGSSIADSGQLSYTITASTSFTIESTNASDANDVAYFIVREL